MILLATFSLLLLVNTILFVLSMLPSKIKTWEELPFVSILIAARNEEDNMKQCLDAILALDYPKDRFEVLVADDESTDATAEVVNQYAEKHGHIQLHSLTGYQSKTKAKARVLAYLTQQAKGEFYFITDADIKVPSGWVKAHLEQHEKASLVSGYTVVKASKSLFSKLQAVDWAYAMRLILGMTKGGKDITAVGNNMSIQKEAFWKTGGYEEIPFSVTEDFALMTALHKHGERSRISFSKDLLATTHAQTSVGDLLKQRVRWTHGAMQVPLVLRIVLFLNFVGQIAGIVGLVLCPYYFAPLYVVKWILHSCMTYWPLRYTKQAWFLLFLPLWEIYSVVFSIVMLSSYLLNPKVEWKNRDYHD